MPSSIVFGVDGMSYAVTMDLVKKGLMPNFRAFMKAGAFGELESTFPPHTAPGWTSMFTGVEPGVHGVYQFWKTKSAGYKSSVTTVQDFGWEPVWETLEKNGYSTGIINVPMSHPPAERPNGGYMITWPLAPTIHYSYPKNLINELADKGLHFHSDLVTMYRGQTDYLDQAVEFVQGRTETLLYLMDNRPVDVVFIVYTEVDRVSHYYWGDDEAPSEHIERIYMEIDKSLGRVMDRLGEGDSLIVASDHGFGKCRENINVHALLEREGLLATRLLRRDSSGHDVTDASDAAIGKSDDFRASWFTSSNAYYRTVDWSETVAYMPTPGCFGLNLNLKGREELGVVEPENATAVFERLVRCFDSFVDDEQVPYFKLVPGSQVYQGARVDDAPDFILKPSRWDIMPHTGMEPEIETAPSQPAVHRMDGVWGMIHATVAADHIEHAKIEDITPTLLVSMGCPVYEGINGDVHFFDKADVTYVAAPEVRRSSNIELLDKEQELMQNKLMDLGYV